MNFFKEFNLIKSSYLNLRITLLILSNIIYINFNLLKQKGFKMHFSIVSKLEKFYKRYKELQNLLGKSIIISNKELFRSLSLEYAQLNNISICFEKWKCIKQDIKATESILNDSELRGIAKEELEFAKLSLNKIEKELQILLIPKDINDERNVFMEIRAGTGGNEAALFAGKLFRMYSRYAEYKLWNVESINMSACEQGGYKEITLKISGTGVYGKLKFESGGHRVQRIPITESHGRVHTSSCTVAVMPEIPEEELPDINSTDLRIDTFRSSGAGGQHVNTTDSAIRITHLPTGIVVECQDERSQHKNKAKALAVLGARIHAAAIEKRNKKEADTRRNLLGSGCRNDRNRTYNFQQGRITDHRINLTLYRLEEVLEGELDILIDPIIKEHQAYQIKSLIENNNEFSKLAK